MLTSYIFVVPFAFLLCVLFIFWLKSIACRSKMFASRGIPLVGGVAMGLSFIISCTAVFLFSKSISQEAIGIITASFIMLIFGIVDDFKELSVLLKVLVQVIAASILVLLGVKTQIVYIGAAANAVITVIWILGITNAFNHLDIIDGLAAGAAFIVSVSLLTVSLLNDSSGILIILLPLAGALSGFLLYNFPPAKVYMGNAGSHFLGFVLAAVTLVISYAPMDRKIALISPLLILGLPILDTAFLICVRLTKKIPPFKKSNDHIALRLISFGYSKRKALLFMLGAGLFFSICGILVSQLITVAYCVIIILLAAGVSFFWIGRMNKLAVNG